MDFETIKSFTFKRIETGEEVTLQFSTNTVLCKFIADISKIFKEKYNIEHYILIQGGTEWAEQGRVYNFYDYPTRTTTVQQLFENTVCFYIKNA
jgi:hypothetical protein